MSVLEAQVAPVAHGLTEVASPTATRSAIKDSTPFAIALIPFGLALGSASATAGLSLTETMFGATVLLAGASQLAAVEVLGSGGGIAATAVVVALINLRFVFYGAGVASWFSGAPLRRRLLLAFPLVDQTFMLCQGRFEQEKDMSWRQRYYVTATAVLASAFLSCQFIAFQLGTSLPDGLGLHLAAPLAFAGMLAKSATDKPHLTAGLVAGLTVVLGSGLLGAAALPLGVIFGVAAATRTAEQS